MPGEARPAAAFEQLDVRVRTGMDNRLLLLRLRLRLRLVLRLRPLLWLRRLGRLRRASWLRRLRPTLLRDRWPALRRLWRWLRNRWPALLRVGLRRLAVLRGGWRLPGVARPGGLLGTTSHPVQARLRTATALLAG